MAASENLIEDEARIAEIVRTARRIAVLGIKTEEQADQAAFYVADFLQRGGAEIVPVPIYYPDAKEILGVPVQRDLASVGPVDIVDVFRRPGDIPKHVADLKKLKPRTVWFQLGIRNDEAARALAEAGIQVVQDRCLKVEWARHRGG